MATYSFINVLASITSPTGITIALGAGAAVAAEGITVERAADQNTMTTGADGAVMHALHAANPGTITVRLLKTAPVNSSLALLYEIQRQSSIYWGQNTITITDIARGDSITASQVAFKRFASITYSVEGAMNEWVFDAGHVVATLGLGTSF